MSKTITTGNSSSIYQVDKNRRTDSSVRALEQNSESNSSSKLLSNGKIGRFVDVGKLSKQALGLYEDKVTLAEKKIDLASKKLQALKDLKSYVGAIKNANDKLVDNSPNGVFNQKFSELSTTDSGSGSDYLSVSTNSTAIVDSYNISVTQLATKAVTMIGHDEGVNSDGTKDGTLTGFDYNDQPMNANNVHIVVGSLNGNADVNIVLNNSDTLIDIANKINNNSELNKNISARILSYPGNATGPKYFLELSSNDLGAASIEVAFDVDNAMDDVYTKSILGTNAKITIDGSASIESSSNKIEIAKGVTVEVLKQNTVGKSQGITIKNDIKAAGEAIINLIDAFNECASFSAEQRKRDGDGKFADTAYLARSSELTMADNMRQNFFSSINGTNLIKLGFKFERIQGTEDIPSHQEFTLNTSTFEKALNDNFEDIRLLFKGEQSIKLDPEGDNANSIIRFSPNSKNPADFPRGVKFDLGAIINATGNVKINCEIEETKEQLVGNYNNTNNIISFEGTKLEGIELYYKNNDNDKTEIYDVKFFQGVSEKFALNLNNIINDRVFPGSGLKKGAIDRAIANLTAQQIQLKNQESKAQKVLNDRQKRLELSFNQVKVAEAKLKLSEKIFKYNNK